MYKPIRYFNKDIACICFGSIFTFTFQSCKEKQAATGNTADRPNVIYVFPDQMRNQAIGIWREPGFREAVNFEGDPVYTPNLNRFAKESVVLTSAMSTCPLSSPHRGMLLTGMYPAHSGVPLNCNANRPISSLREDATCISDVFSQAGYNCAYIGKLHVDCPTPNDPDRPGKYVEDRIPAWDAYTPTERRHGLTIGIHMVLMMYTNNPIIGIPMAYATILTNGHLSTKLIKQFPIYATKEMSEILKSHFS